MDANFPELHAVVQHAAVPDSAQVLTVATLLPSEGIPAEGDDLPKLPDGQVCPIHPEVFAAEFLKQSDQIGGTSVRTHFKKAFETASKFFAKDNGACASLCRVIVW